MRQGEGRGRRRASELSRMRVISTLGLGGGKLWQVQRGEGELGDGDYSGRGEGREDDW